MVIVIQLNANLPGTLFIMESLMKQVKKKKIKASLELWFVHIQKHY